MSTLQTISKLFSPIKHAKRYTFLQALVLTTWPLQGVITVFVMKKATDFLMQGDVQQFTRYLRAFACYIVGDKIFQYFTRDWTWVRMPETYINIINTRYIPKFLQLDINYSDKKWTGYMMHLIEKWVEERSDAIRNSIRYGTGLIVTIVFVLYSFSSLDRYISVAFYSAIILSIWLVLYLSKYILPMRKKESEQKNQIARYFVKIIMSKIEILQSNSMTRETLAMNDMNTQLIELKKSRSGLLIAMYIIPELFINLMKFVVLCVVGYGIFAGTFVLSDFVLMIWAINIMETAVSEFTSFYKDLQTNFSRISTMRDVIDNGPLLDLHAWKTFKIQNSWISLQNIIFGYDDDNKIFENFSIEIQAKKKTALVGLSGGGKSTLIKLIAWYLQPDSGSVIVDEQDLKDVSLLSYYKHIGYLTQEPSVFDGTIRENLGYGLLDQSTTVNQTKQSIETVLPLAKCERIYDLPNGLDTEIGERGIRLSGGQKQRLAIAKIMLKNPDIILLDEPTSALDSTNEKAVTEALNNLFKNKTVIIIAHRLQTVKNADDIIYIANGKVIERGNHDELLAHWGEYYTMVELQSGF